MTKPGPKPQPSVMKLINGNPGRRPVTTPDFQPHVSLPDAPDWLTAAARAEWDRLGPILLGYAMISEADLAAFALYCAAYGDWVTAERELREREARGERAQIVMSPNGYPQLSPLVILRNKAREQVLSYLQQFGLSPSSRERVTPSAQLGLFGDDGTKGEAGAGRFFR